MSKREDGKDSPKEEVYYDGDCPMCRAFVAQVDSDSSADFRDFRRSALPEAVDRAAVEDAVHLVDDQNRVLKGADAVLHILTRHPKLGFAARIMQYPPLIWLARLLYPLVAANRFVMFGPCQRLYWSKVVVVLAVLIPMPITRRLFFGEHARFYPLIPVHPALPAIPFPLDYAIFAALIALLLGALLRPDPRRWIAAFLVLGVGYSLFDQSRWMPYYVEFAWMLLALTLYPWKLDRPEEELKTLERRRLNTLGMILVGIWFWSGFHKVSAKYLFVGFPWMVEPLIGGLSPTLKSVVYAGAFLSPVIESGGALFLLFAASRRLGIVLLTLMHLFILLAFGPLGLNWNPSVWSWNVSHIALLWLIFYRTPETGAVSLVRSRGAVHACAVLFFCVLPVLNLFGRWDDFMSHALYSWTTQEAEIVLHSDAVRQELPEEVQNAIRPFKGKDVVHILEWSFSLFESPPYHAERVFRKIFAKVCSAVEHTDDLELVLFDKPHWLSGISPRRSLRCIDVRPGEGSRSRLSRSQPAMPA